MNRQLSRLSLVFAGAFLLVAAAAVYWGLLRAPDLTSRADNPRRILLERRLPRGPILDRHGAVLAEAVGSPGEFVRRYPYPALSSLLGYVSPLYGRTGIEAAFDPVLHGDDGYSEFDLWQLSTVQGTPPPGRAVRLSLDLGLQRAADGALAGRPGAVVVLDSRTGEILALASHPTYDSNALEAAWPDLVADPRSPLLNRATLGLYQPGAALAPAILATALAMGEADLSQAASGEPLSLGGRVLTCGEPLAGQPALAEALAAGCPAPLASLGQSLGADALASLFESLRLYAAPAISVPAGAAPAITPVDPALAAVGQDGLVVSPLQMALVTAAIAEHGRLPVPRLVLSVQARDGAWQDLPTQLEARQALPAAAADEVAAWMARGHSAQAFSGSDGALLAWYLGFTTTPGRHLSVAVLLEIGDVAAAAAIGQSVLAAADP